MRLKRGMGAVLILLYWLGPLVAALPAGADSRLPACCRRYGAHHCAMAAAATGAVPGVSAPAHCSSFPTGAVATPGPVHALTPHLLRIPFLLRRTRRPALHRAAARQGQVRIRVPRGPPAVSHA